MEPIVVDGEAWPYQVTWDGLIWSDRGKRFLKYSLNNGYECLKLKGKAFQVHRLVALAFLPNDSPETKTQVDHIDGNKTNNEITNLCWVTPSENMRRAMKTRKHFKVPVKRISPSGEIKVYESAAFAEREDGYISRRVTDCCKGRKKTYKGFRWEHLYPQKRQSLDIDIAEAKQIYDYQNYVIFKDGRVYNKKRKRYKKASTTSNYPRIQLKAPKRKPLTYMVHILVSDHFIAPREYRLDNELQVNHKDYDKHNPHVDNLELVTHSENMIHAFQRNKN